MSKIEIPSGVRFVHFTFTDLLGGANVVAVPAARVPELSDGLVFDGSATEGFARTFEEDKRLVPDPSTAVQLPWEPEILRLTCDVVELDGTSSPYAPRGVLRRVVDRAAEDGLSLSASWELEFFVFREGLVPADAASYFDETDTVALSAVREAIDALESAGIDVLSSHHEVAPGQFEIDLAARPAVAAADAVAVAKHVIRRAASRHGLVASFMPKPLDDTAGSGLHVHQDLTHDGAPALVSSGTLTDAGRAFVAGQLAHAPALCAIAAPLVNSYRRLAAGFEAPVQPVWAHVNRAALIRVSRAGSGYAPVEFRLPDPASNPYLLLAGLFAAGLDGIEESMELSEPVEEDVYEFEPARLDSTRVHNLPATLSAALDALVMDDVIADALGTALVDRYVTARRIETEAFARHVSGWEIDRYLGHA